VFVNFWVASLDNYLGLQSFRRESCEKSKGFFINFISVLIFDLWLFSVCFYFPDESKVNLGILTGKVRTHKYLLTWNLYFNWLSFNFYASDRALTIFAHNFDAISLKFVRNIVYVFLEPVYNFFKITWLVWLLLLTSNLVQGTVHSCLIYNSDIFLKTGYYEFLVDWHITHTGRSLPDRTAFYALNIDICIIGRLVEGVQKNYFVLHGRIHLFFRYEYFDSLLPFSYPSHYSVFF